jgi:polysaccharide deacetylase 2 family uncharacterized protein YibQ
MKKEASLPIRIFVYWLLAFFMFSISPVKAEPIAKIALIMDDMGLSEVLGCEAIQLHGAVTYSFLVNAPYAHQLAASAYRKGKELMLHAPMQAIAKREQEAGELKQGMVAQKFKQLFVKQLNSIPHISGVNNHKGSLLTQNYSAMTRIMALIKNYNGEDLFFVDSKTSQQSIAGHVASEFGIATFSRDIFLDHDSPSEEEIRRQFRRLIDIALTQGQALAIAHPRKATLKILRQELAQLSAYGVQLVSVSELVDQPKRNRVKQSFRSIPARQEKLGIITPAEEIDVF